jgi:hypothetical protein
MHLYLVVKGGWSEGKLFGEQHGSLKESVSQNSTSKIAAGKRGVLYAGGRGLRSYLGRLLGQGGVYAPSHVRA